MAKHDELVSKLERILIIENDNQIWKFLEYNKSDRFIRNIISRGNGRVIINPLGEVDLLREMNDYWEFYEIKSSSTINAMNHAAEQYARFRNHFKQDMTVGFLYYGDSIIKL